MTSSLVFGVVLAWGAPFAAAPQNDGAYLGVIERRARDPHDADKRSDDVWARVAFKRADNGDWVPALVAEKLRAPEPLQAAADRLPARITWRACRDGRSIGTIVSSRRHLEVASQLGAQALQSPPAFVENAPNDERFTVITTGLPAARPFVISTLRDACAAPSALRGASPAVANVARLVLTQRNLHTGKANRLLDARGWQASDWTIVDLTLEEAGGWFAVVAFAIGDDIRYTVKGARVVDWISADRDGVPDAVLWIDGADGSGYMLVYGDFAKHAELEWTYR